MTTKVLALETWRTVNGKITVIMTVCGLQTADDGVDRFQLLDKPKEVPVVKEFVLITIWTRFSLSGNTAIILEGSIPGVSLSRLMKSRTRNTSPL